MSRGLGVSVCPAWLRSCPEIIRVVVLGALIASGAASATERHRFLVRGIDVSHYQGTINWPAVAGDDVAFAYVKATEGVAGRDAQFARNWRGARRAGIRVGAYHFFIFCRSPRAQARNFLAVAPRTASALPPAVDLETARGCRSRLTGAEVRRELNAYLTIVEARQRRPAVIYVNSQFYAAYGRDLPKRAMWRRSISFTPNRSWTFWQYRSRGHVTGIRTRVDLNVVRASRFKRAL